MAKWIDGLFAKFAVYYGHIWRSQYKDEGFLAFAKQEWLEALSTFSEGVLNKAVLQCRDFYELPPTLPQMMACCRQIRNRFNFYVVNEPYHPAKPQVVKAHLKQCKDLLTKK